MFSHMPAYVRWFRASSSCPCVWSLPFRTVVRCDVPAPRAPGPALGAAGCGLRSAPRFRPGRRSRWCPDSRFRGSASMRASRDAPGVTRTSRSSPPWPRAPAGRCGAPPASAAITLTACPGGRDLRSLRSPSGSSERRRCGRAAAARARRLGKDRTGDPRPLVLDEARLGRRCAASRPTRARPVRQDAVPCARFGA